MTFRRFTDKPDLDPQSVRSLPDGHPALVENRTLFPSTVVTITDGFADRLLVSGKNNRKLGEVVAKGKFKGYLLYGLSLEERATCPEDCSARSFCYGNAMQLARRHRIDDGGLFYKFLESEIVALMAEPAAGVLVRLHVLGDFPNVEYVAFWADMLSEHDRLACYGYTHRRTRGWDGDHVGDAIEALKDQYPDRFRIRWSGPVSRPDGAVITNVVPRHPRADEGLVCPAQTDATACCATCGFCWEPAARHDTVVFVKHGPKSAEAAAVEAMRATQPTFRELVTAQVPTLRRFAQSLCKDATKAEDLVQETMVRALSNERGFEMGTNVVAWLFTILRNIFLSEARKAGREVADEDILLAAPDITLDANDLIDAKKALSVFEQLGADHREAIRDVAGGMSYKEVAEKHGVAVGTIKSRINRGRSELADALQHAVPRSDVPASYRNKPLRNVSPIMLPPSVRPSDIRTPVPDVRLVRPTDLQIESSYQRDLSGKSIKLIKKIVAGWDWAKFKPPVCAESEVGLFVIDGQHTAIAAATHPEIEKIPVMIVQAEAMERRADAFVAHNKDRLAMSAFQIFHAEVAAGDPVSVTVAAIADEVGAIIPRSQPMKGYAKAGQIVAIDGIKGFLRIDGAAMVRRVLNIAVKARLAPLSAMTARAIRMVCKDARFAAVAALDDSVIAAAVMSIKNIDMAARIYASESGQGRDRACANMIAAAVREHSREAAA